LSNEENGTWSEAFELGKRATPSAQPEAVVPEVLHFTGRADLEASLDALVSGPPKPRWWLFDNNRECADMRARYAALLSAFVTAHD
jgi:hypothetical protein